MIITLADGRRFDASRPVDISIPLLFNGPQPNAYGVEPASSRACEYGTLVGDTRRGGSCNFEQYTLIPHCNGTHTECIGHITNERISVRDCLRETMLPAALITVSPAESGETCERYPIALQPGDKLITAVSIKTALRTTAPLMPTDGSCLALVIRTSPNDDSKLTRLYDASNVPPYFTNDAIRLVVELGCKHLLVDLPSIDRIFDDGGLSNHRIFWNVDEGSFAANPQSSAASTITELAYIPDSVPDGSYLLNLQIAPFATDAAPSRPLLSLPVDQA